MATASTATNLSGLALRLVRDNLLSPTDAERIQAEALSKKTSFVTQLVESKKLDSATIAKVASDDFGIPLYEINSLDLEMAPVKLVDEKIIRRHHVLPLFKRGTRLFVAVADPTNLQALDEIKFHTGLGTEPILVEEAKLAAIIEKSLDAQDTSLSDLAGDDSLENLEIVAGEEDEARRRHWRRRRRQRCAGRQVRQQGSDGRHQPRSLGYSYRALRKNLSRALPAGWHAVRSCQSAD